MSLAFAMASSALFGATITSVGVPMGASSSAAGSISGINGVVGVTSDYFSDNPRAGRWDTGGGLTTLTPLSGASGGVVEDVSHDGTVIVGASIYPDLSAHATRWNGGVAQDLGILSTGTYSLAQGVSGNGQVVAGTADDGPGIVAFRWTSGAGLVPLGTLTGGTYSEGRKLNQDGSVLIGAGDNASGQDVALRWTQASGLQALPFLSASDTRSGAFGVNSAGNVIVGFSGENAAAWIDGVPQNLGRLPGSSGGIAYACSADGSLIGGYSFFGFNARATLWLPGTGQVELATYLQILGVDLTGWNLQYIRDISADGLTIVGEGDFNGTARGWVVMIPTPAGAVVLGLGGLLAARGRRRR